MLDFLEYDPIMGTQAPENVIWNEPDFEINIPITFNTPQINGLQYFSSQEESLARIDLSHQETFNFFSTILSDTKTEAATPSLLHVPSPAPAPTSVDAGPSVEADEIIGHPHPLSLPGASLIDSHCGRRSTWKSGSNATCNQLGLHEQFADTMKTVQQLPTGERPKNALFTPFFTRECGHYVCLLCPVKNAKVLVNRTQIIQHIAGGHGKNRPFACSHCPRRATRKADIQKHMKETHGSSKWHCSKCSKAFSNQRNTRRHEKLCPIST